MSEVTLEKITDDAKKLINTLDGVLNLPQEDVMSSIVVCIAYQRGEEGFTEDEATTLYTELWEQTTTNLTLLKAVLTGVIKFKVGKDGDLFFTVE